MRKRTNMNGLVSHTTPSGASYQSGRNKCEQGIKKLQKLIDAGYELTGVKPVEEPKKVVIAISGWEALGSITISFKDFKENYEGQPVKIIRKI